MRWPVPLTGTRGVAGRGAKRPGEDGDSRGEGSAEARAVGSRGNARRGPEEGEQARPFAGRLRGVMYPGGFSGSGDDPSVHGSGKGRAAFVVFVSVARVGDFHPRGTVTREGPCPDRNGVVGREPKSLYPSNDATNGGVRGRLPPPQPRSQKYFSPRLFEAVGAVCDIAVCAVG